MTINNHRRIDILENELESEKARVRFLEDFSDQLGHKVNNLEKSVDSCKREVSRQKKNLTTILGLVKLLSKHEKVKRGKFFESVKGVTVCITQNAIIFGIVQVLMKITWMDSLIDSLTELLKIGRILSDKSAERSKFMVKFGISLTIFLLLRDKIKKLLLKLKEAISFLV